MTVAVVLIAHILHIASAAWCELFVYADPNQGGVKWPSGTGFDIGNCRHTDGNFENDAMSSARLYSRSNYACTAIFYDGCGCMGSAQETLVAGPNQQNTMNFGSVVNDKLSCILLTVATTTTLPPTQPTSQPSTATQPPTSQSSTPTSNPSAAPTNEPTRYPTLEPTTYPSTEPTGYPTGEPTAYPTIYPTIYPTMYPTLYPTPYRSTYVPTLNPVRRYEINYGVVITVKFEYNTSNITEISLELAKITKEIIMEQVLQNNLTNCVVPNDYDISVVNTAQSVQIRAVIFVCNNDAENTLYVAFNKHLETDFIQKTKLTAIQPTGLYVDIESIAAESIHMTTTKEIITSTVLISEGKKNMMTMDITIITIMVVMGIIILVLISIVLWYRMRYNKLAIATKHIDVEMTANTNHTNRNKQRINSESTRDRNAENGNENEDDNDNELKEEFERVGSQTVNIETNADETDSGEDINEMYNIGQSNDTPQYKVDPGNGSDDDLYSQPIAHSNTRKTETTITKTMGLV